MSLSDLSKQLDARKQTSTKEQPYAMGRQTVRKARTDSVSYTHLTLPTSDLV